MHRLIAELFPICRSITGPGLRQSLAILQRHIPLQVNEIPSGTNVFDWTIPNEWTLREAYIADSTGRRVVDSQQHNLHVVNYSIPFRGRLSLEQLKPHLHTLPDHPDWIPYRTSYYQPAWGFCLSHRQVQSLNDDFYDVVIDSTLAPGSLTLGQFVIPGNTSDEILLSAHICHPSLANDNLSSIAVLTFAAIELARRNLRHTIRCIFAPGTIGAIAWLAQNQATVPRIRHGLILSNLGDTGAFTYKRSRRGDATIDRALPHVLSSRGAAHNIIDFSPYGYDERQYCSPGFNLPVGMFSRSLFATFPQYHTSADNLDFVKPDALDESLAVLLDTVDLLDTNLRYANQVPHCEPQLGKRGLYDSPQSRPRDFNLAMLWVLNLSDSSHDLLDIARQSGLPFSLIAQAAQALAQHDLIQPTTEPHA